MLEVFWLTLDKVGMLLVYIAIGYFLRRHHDLPDDAGRVMSLLTTLLFSPAYTISNLSQSFTMDVIGEKAQILGYGAVFVIAAFILAYVLARIFAKGPVDRSSLIYAFSIPNYGYFGYPVIEGVFGSAVLADVMIFLIPLSFATSSIGYMLFMRDQKIPWKKLLLTPMVLSVFIGAAIGLSGLRLPSFISGMLSGAGSCMSPCSMLLAGFMLGKFPLKKLLTGFRPYYLSAIRLVLIPVIFGAVLLLTGVKGIFLQLPMLVTALPLGLNLVVYPESCGHEKEASDNAKLCFVSYLMAVAVLPFSFAILSYLLQ